MQHIINPDTGSIDFDNYTAYLQSVRQLMPEHVYSFASDPSFFDLTSRNSLHDAWLDAITIQEVATGTRGEVRRLEINLRLVGPFHDRHIHLRYEGVTAYALGMPSRHGVPRYEHTSHGDLYTHEVCVAANGLLTHELSFERDSAIMIECTNITHWQTSAEAA